MTADTLAWRTSMVVLLGCAFLVGLTLAGIGLASADRTGVTGYFDGELVDLPSESFKGRARTLLVFLRSDCVASQALAASMSELRAVLPPGGVEYRAVVSDGLPDREVAFAESAGFQRASILSVDFRKLRLSTVPALVLVDGDGVVQFERLGAGPGWTDALALLPRLAYASVH